MGAVLKQAGIDAKVVAASDKTHTQRNDDLGKPDDPAAKVMYEFFAEAFAKRKPRQPRPGLPRSG